VNRAFVNVTLPVLNEERLLAASVEQVVAFLDDLGRYDYELVIANNGSTDGTQAVVEELCRRHARVRAVQLPEAGRGRALKAAWAGSRADVLSYMDANLPSDLGVFPRLLDSVLAGECDLAVGSRLLNPATTRRGLKREVMSQVYSRLVRGLFRVRFSDPQCGFKVLRRESASQLLPLVADNGWFFDTELLVLAERAGWRILDVPVPWVERKETRVQLWRTVLADLQGLLRLRRKLRQNAS
jgi:glycosyltransferase involved in cell wall biosynthesis